MKRLTKATKVLSLLSSGYTPAEVAKRLKCAVSYVYVVRSQEKKKDVPEETMPVTTAHTKNSILDDAHNIIYGDREKTYGNPAKNLTLIGKLWGEYLGVTVTPEDVCLLMILLKTARLKNDTTHRDGMVDLCGYAALMERVQEEVK